jgi:hypothetical protein
MFESNNLYNKWFRIAVGINIAIFVIYIIWHDYLVDKCFWGLCEFFKNSKSIWFNILSFDNPVEFFRNIFILTVGIITALFNARKIYETQRDNDVKEKKLSIDDNTRYDNLFAKAVDFLKESNDLMMKRGGIHILSSLGTTDIQQSQRCIDMLCSVNEQWMPKILKDYPNILNDSAWVSEPNIKDWFETKGFSEWDKEGYSKLLENISLSQESIKAITQIILWFDTNHEVVKPLFFFKKYICGIELYTKNKLWYAPNSKVNYDGSFMNGAKFKCFNNGNQSYSVFANVCLRGADFNNSNCTFEFHVSDLSFASFNDCKIGESTFVLTNLEGTDFKNTDISNIQLN